MRSLDMKAEMRQLLARFTSEVSYSSAQSFTDINRASQDILVKLLSIAYDLPGLRNLDLDKANNPGIDLADDDKSTAIQVTSTVDPKKIHDTLKTFTKYELDKKYKCLYIYILSENRPESKAQFANDLPKGFVFSPKEHITGAWNLSAKFDALSDIQKKSFLRILQDDFGDEPKTEAAFTRQKFASHEAVFVAPMELPKAQSILDRNGLVILTGPPHIGKTETAYELLLRSTRTQSDDVLYLTSLTDWSKLFSYHNQKLLLDDPFGDVSYENGTLGNRFGDLLRLAQSNSIAITSRNYIFKTATDNTKMRDDVSIDEYNIELRPGISYDADALSDILRRHISVNRLSKSSFPKITDEQENWLLSNESIVVGNLPFPHNIERLVALTAATGPLPHSIYELIEKANAIVPETMAWYLGQATELKFLFALTALFPGISTQSVPSLIVSGSKVLNFSKRNLKLLMKDSRGYLLEGSSIEYEHPSYREGVLSGLRGDDIDFAWDVISHCAAHVGSDLLALVSCERASKLLKIGSWLTTNLPSPPSTGAEEFLFSFVHCYNTVLSTNFPTIRSSFYPHINDDCAVVGVVNDAEELEGYCLVRSNSNGKPVNLIQRKTTVQDRPQLPLLEFLATYSNNGNVRYVDLIDFERAIPQLSAVDDITRFLKNHLKDDDGGCLDPSWHLRLARLFRQLKSVAYPISTISPSSPLTSSQLLEFVERLKDIQQRRAILGGRSALLYSEDGTVTKINKLNISMAVSDIAFLEGVDKKVEGSLLTPPDLSQEDFLKTNSSYQPWDLYSDKQLELAAKHGIRMYFEAYKETVERTFPTICKVFPIYQRFPMLVMCVLDLRRFNKTNFVPVLNIAVSTFRHPAPSKLMNINVQSITDQTDDLTRESIVASMQGRRSWVSNSTGFFAYEEGWLSKLYDDISSDLRYVLDNAKFA